MHRNTLWTLAFILAAGPAVAGTFDARPVAPELGLDVLNRGVARAQTGRSLFANPYATVTIGNVDVYPVFPYVESRTFQVVSDPRWNRLVFGEAGRSLRAYDGRSGPLGALKEPRGLAVDEHNRVYVADAGNDRIVVLQASTEFGDITLSPLYEIRGLHDPHDVAHSDAGTPFAPEDDLLYIADTGANRVVAFALSAAGARQAGAVGALGSGRGHFAGPMAIAVGRASGANTPDVYVADAHTRRVVHLRHEAGTLRWMTDASDGVDVVTSLDTDEWGNLYAAAPNQGVVRKFTADLSPVADLGALARPRGFHVPFVNVRDHRAGSVARVGRPAGVSVDEWTEATGVRLWSLGVEVAGLSVESREVPTATFTLTDRAGVTVEILDRVNGRSLARRSAGVLDAGAHALPLTTADLAAAAGAHQPTIRIAATSAYAEGPTAQAQAPLGAGGAALLPSRPMLLSSGPNPARSVSRISFVLPVGDARSTLRVYDATGRVVRHLGGSFTPGFHEIEWDGRNDRGLRAAAGVYFYRLDVGEQSLSRSLALVP